jgi:hypothetical protein
MFGLTKKFDSIVSNYDTLLRTNEALVRTMATEVQILREALDHERCRNDELHNLFYQYFGLRQRSEPEPTSAISSASGTLRRWRDQRAMLEKKFSPLPERPEELEQREKMWKQEAAKAAEEVNQCLPSQENNIG